VFAIFVVLLDLGILKIAVTGLGTVGTLVHRSSYTCVTEQAAHGLPCLHLTNAPVRRPDFPPMNFVVHDSLQHLSRPAFKFRQSAVQCGNPGTTSCVSPEILE
jgi:hypothetical protein